MVIKQTRVRNLSKLKAIRPGTRIRIAATQYDGKRDILTALGFSTDFVTGEVVLPGIIGPATRKNAEGHIIKHRDRPMEKHSRMIEWTYKQWAGRGETKEVTDWTTREYARYPRTFVPPLAIEFMVVEKDGLKIIVSPEIEFNNTNEDIIVMAINVLLEAFGECEILDAAHNPVMVPHAIRLNWEVLPRGEYPWEIQKTRLEPFFARAKGNNRPVIEKRLEEINRYKPDFAAIGSGGFGGYVVHGFVDKDLYVLESTQVNNATYILKSDWERISQLSKSEILNNDLHEARVIHSKQWFASIAQILV